MPDRPTGQVDGGLGMAGPAQHASFLGHEREQMPWPNQFVRPRRRVDDRSDRPRPLLGADARAARDVVDRHGVRRLVRGRVPLDHRPELKTSGRLGQDRHAQEPPPVRDHELDRLGTDLLGCRDEVTLVLPILIVDDNDDPPFPKRLQGVVDPGEFILHGRFQYKRDLVSGSDRASPPARLRARGISILPELAISMSAHASLIHAGASEIVKLMALHVADQEMRARAFVGQPRAGVPSSPRSYW